MGVRQVRSTDGTFVVGEPHGNGPPIVFISGALADETTSWAMYPPAFTDVYTCWMMSTRGRGSSADHDDHSLDRLVDDIVCFVSDVGGPVGLVGHSSTGALALEAAARSGEVAALALYEPTLFEFADEEFTATFERCRRRMEELVEEGSPAAAALLFLHEIAKASDEEVRLLSDVGAVDGMARYVPTLLQEARQWGAPHLSDLDVLDHVTIPVLVMLGSRTDPFWNRISTELDGRLVDARQNVIDGASHLGPIFSAESVASRMREFFDETLSAPTHH